MKETNFFLAPRLTGSRFNDHTLPVDILEDFVALEELILELAKNIYLKENPQRKRIPKGFTEQVSLKLSSIEPGSSIPQFLLVYASVASSILGLQNTENLKYFEKAKEKIINLIDCADKGLPFDNELEDKYLNYFNKIGKNLRADEIIFFQPDSVDSLAKLDKNVRNKIILSINKNSEYIDDFERIALIPSIDKSNKTLVFEIDDNKVTSIIDSSFIDTIKITFDEYDINTCVSIKGKGVFNKQNKLIKIESINAMDILDPLDINLQINKLLKIEDNWHGPDSLSPSKIKLKEFSEIFSHKYNDTNPLPAVYPTFDGNIQLEWTINNNEVSLEINLTTLQSEISILDTISDKFIEKSFDLNIDEDWSVLNKYITNLSM